MMRIILGFLCGLVGMLAGWFGLAFLIVALAGEGDEGGTAMGAFFGIGPIGGLIGFVVGVVLFLKIGLVRAPTPSPDAAPAQAVPATLPAPVPSEPAPSEPAPSEPAPSEPALSRISRPFAAVIVTIAALLCWWGWYELIRSPDLSHGFMTLDLQFRLPAGAALPPDTQDLQVDVTDGSSRAFASFNGTAWHGHDGNRPVILATVSIMYKTRRRIVTLSLPGYPPQSWTLDLAGDPDPTPGYTSWRAADGVSAQAVEMKFRLEGK